ncbi:homeobox protein LUMINIDEPENDENS-like [Pyrus ussuriensis x Pyrus communis]|uniref:Homeobox protein LUMINIDEPENDENS-like n=1 Tax=Pyrus ussuriensis x Pyrus communis TaxID=2448454 RepID=A0A5N5GN78_9ROSA|nr:homeobox protein LUMINIDEPENDENS-like [Pyrus ussuriensis x Pyrus communis]
MENPSVEMEIGTSAESLGKFLDSQRELFHSQIDQLQRIVGTQCKLTGVNPLSQEMAAGALSIKIDGPIAGKRPRDLLNPKAIKYMQSIFSIKDTISKKESRELSALFGVTVTQVRDFFNSQRSRVRKLVQLSREKALKSGEHEDLHDGVSTSPDSLIPSDPVPLNSVGPSNVDDAPSCSTQDSALSGLDDLDKRFVEDIFNLMRKEETFSGQVKLMEWIMRIQNSSVLCWFLTNGGVMILVTWLSQAAVEEQTSVLLVILKVLCHLPLHKALPLHMSAVLQSVNRLRFYRTPDISNRARVLLSRWSKLLARSQAMKKPNGIKTSSDSEELVILKQSIDEVMGDSESWKSNMDISEDILGTPFEGAENRKLEASEPLKLLTASPDESNKKNILGVSSSQFRERRKVQLVEQPGQSAGRSVPATRTTTVSQARPMSADDIQKAKMRAQFMQSKYGKSRSSHENKELKTEGVDKLTISQASILPVVPKVPIRSNIEEPKIPATNPLKEREIPNKPETSLAPKRSLDLKEPILEKCPRIRIPWKMPPEIKLDPSWSVGGGEYCKEIEVQRNRNRREKETIYRTVQEIPSNPKEPWDIEMDYDDSLTPEIPIEQPPDVADTTETQASHNREVYNAETMVVRSQGANNVASFPRALSQINNASAAEPDLELLAVLLKNPELVFALTSGDAANLSSEDTVKLLDMIKSGGAGVAGNVNGLGRKTEERVEVSLPSPTPSSNPGTSGWKGDAGRNAFPQQMPQVSSAHHVIPPQRLSTSQPAVPSYSPDYHRMQSPASEMALTMKNTHFHNVSNTAVPPIWGEGTINVERAPLSNSYNVAERQQPLFSTPARQQRQPQPVQQSPFSEPHIPMYTPKQPMGKPGPPSDSWRARQDLPSNYHYIENPNQYNASYGGHLQAHLLPGPSWEGNEHVGGEQDFQSWSPDNSPSRNPGYMYGREPRTNPGQDYRSRGRNPAGYRDHNRQQGNRWPNRGGR